MSFEKIMEASTAYITSKDNDLLKDRFFPLVVYEYEYGYFVHCPEMDERMAAECREFGASEDFINLVRLAQQNGCKYLQLDCDGDTGINLPKHEW